MTTAKTTREYAVPGKYSIAETANCADTLVRHRAAHPDRTMFRRKVSGGPWTDVSTRDFAQDVESAARGLIAHGVAVGDRVALMSGTRYEWQVFDFAIWFCGAITVPIYDSSSPEQIRWILEDSEAVVCIVETPEHRTRAEEVIDSVPAQHLWMIERSADQPETLLDFLAVQGASVDPTETERRIKQVQADDPATLIYTSGTTGRPKGCVLTHRNFIAEAVSVTETSFIEYMREGLATLMFLPLAHVLARTITYAAIQKGVIVGHWADTTTLVPQFAEFKPDFILSVPRVFEKVFTTAQSTAHAAGGIRPKIFDASVDTAIEWSKAEQAGSIPLTLKLRRALFDKLVYGKLKNALGGQCQVAISGGAPLGERLGHFFNGLGFPVLEGYGLTETSAALSVNTPTHRRIGSVGRPLPGAAARVGEDGEILVKGPMVFPQYWKNENATAEAFTDEWFHTGDLGSISDDGYIYITGRKKELIVTASGKNVSPAALEDSLRGNKLISQAVCVGDQKPFISALITIDAEAFEVWKKDNGKPEEAAVKDLIRDPDLVAAIDDAVKQANTLVSRAESIKKFRILPEDFTEESGELTPTMKIKRKVVHDRWAEEISAIYTR